jgi:hypothetical protein
MMPKNENISKPKIEHLRSILAFSDPEQGNRAGTDMVATYEMMLKKSFSTAKIEHFPSISEFPPPKFECH